MTGIDVTEAAARAGVDRGTVVRWITGGVVTGRGHRGRRSPRVRLVAWRDARGWRLSPQVLDAYVRIYVRTRPAPTHARGGVLVVRRTMASKLGDAAATYAARQTCPAACPFRAGGGCYADYDNPRTHWERVTRGGVGLSAEQVAANEAAGIDTLPADRDLRLHVAGDSPTRPGTRLIAAAAGRYLDRAAGHGRPVAVWTYTHAWAAVPRADWGRVAVLASCETPADVRRAWARGYAAAVAVPAFASDRAYDLGGVRVVPCPAQTRGVVCTDCRLCFDPGRLLDRRLAIGFAAHGSGRGKASETLRRVALPLAA